MSTYALDDNKVVGEGILRAITLQAHLRLFGSEREKAWSITMIIRFLSGGSRCGSSTGSGMPQYPDAALRHTRRERQKIIGFKIKTDSENSPQAHRRSGRVCSLDHLLTSWCRRRPRVLDSTR